MNHRIFNEPFGNLISSKAKEIVHEINSQPDEYFDSIPIDEFSTFLISKYSLDEFPTLIWEEIQMDFGETEIYGRDLPSTFDISNPNEKFKRSMVEFEIPMNGHIGLLRFHPTKTFSTKSIYGTLSIKGNNLCLSFIDIYNKPEYIESDFEKSKNTLIGRLNTVKGEYDNYHKDLPRFVNDEINKRVRKINHANEYKSKFKYPIKKKNVPTAFESPRIVKKRKISPKPVGTSKSITNQRFISDEDYMH